MCIFRYRKLCYDVHVEQVWSDKAIIRQTLARVDKLSDITNIGTTISTHDMWGLRKYERYQKLISYSRNY